MRAASLRCYMNLLALQGDAARFEEKVERVIAARYDGVQFADWGSEAELQYCRQAGLPFAGSGRVNAPADAADIAQRLVDGGYQCGTLHVGWGLESDPEADFLIDAILEASERFRMPLYIETHRATICQDMWRTVQFVLRFPMMRFNGDFSHWYAGQEMVYGGFGNKMQFIQPVLERIRFLHGRVASPGCIQVPYHSEAIYAEHFRQLWTESFRGFLQDAEAGPTICFAPELLGPDIFYARQFGGVEESNRWKEALVLREVAQACFAVAQRS